MAKRNGTMRQNRIHPITQAQTMNTTTPSRFDQRHAPSHKSTALPAGAVAPDFTLRSTPDQFVSLSDFRGQPVVLAFYPADWSPVCGDQMTLYNEILPEFQELGAELLERRLRFLRSGTAEHNPWSTGSRESVPIVPGHSVEASAAWMR